MGVSETKDTMYLTYATFRVPLHVKISFGFIRCICNFRLGSFRAWQKAHRFDGINK